MFGLLSEFESERLQIVNKQLPNSALPTLATLWPLQYPKSKQSFDNGTFLSKMMEFQQFQMGKS